jgi:hypothetical protein
MLYTELSNVGELTPMKTLVILMASPLTAQIYDHVGIPYLKEHFKVLVLDCSLLLEYSKPTQTSIKSDGVEIIGVKSLSHLNDLLVNYNPQYAIDFIGLQPKFLPICRLLNRNSVKLFIQRTGPLPGARGIKFRGETAVAVNVIQENRDIHRAGFRGVSNFKVLSLACRYFPKFLERLSFLVLIVRFKRFRNVGALLAGKESLDKITRHANPILWIGSNDYHHFMRSSAFSKDLFQDYKNNKGYIVFIDDCIAEAHDWEILGMKAPVTREKYYREMRDVFDEFEKILNLEVVVAGHPNAITNANYSSNFGNRQIVFGATAKLVKGATVCATHFSTATSFAVLAGKPIISLTSEELEGTPVGKRISIMSLVLNTTFISISSPIHESHLEQVMEVDTEKYLNYKENYLRDPRCSEASPWQEFIEYTQNY